VTKYYFEEGKSVFFFKYGRTVVMYTAYYYSCKRQCEHLELWCLSLLIPSQEIAKYIMTSPKFLTDNEHFLLFFRYKRIIRGVRTSFYTSYSRCSVFHLTMFNRAFLQLCEVNDIHLFCYQVFVIVCNFSDILLFALLLRDLPFSRFYTSQ
jgi:hypothetical protein